MNAKDIAFWLLAGGPLVLIVWVCAIGISIRLVRSLLS